MASHARLYHNIRTAHLERARELPPATIVYLHRRYDFDQELSAGLDLVDGGCLRAHRWLLAKQPDVLEINEPLMAESALWTASLLLGLRARQRFSRARTKVVTYAIENRGPQPGDPPPPRLRGRVRQRLQQAATRYIWAQLDRIAYGTAAAQELYEGRLGRPPRAKSTLIWALPAAVPSDSPKRQHQAVFVSAFSERKGVPELLAAWPKVVAQLPSARLMLIGKGSLLSSVLEAAAADRTIRVVQDPPRAQLRNELAVSSVLVLPSRPFRLWREQVGLPIVEGLSYGCTVVTTAETGLSQWLREQEHQVIPAPADPDLLAESIAVALSNPLPPAEVKASLRTRDGRLAADDWLFERVDSESTGATHWAGGVN